MESHNDFMSRVSVTVHEHAAGNVPVPGGASSCSRAPTRGSGLSSSSAILRPPMAARMACARTAEGDAPPSCAVRATCSARAAVVRGVVGAERGGGGGGRPPSSGGEEQGLVNKI